MSTWWNPVPRTDLGLSGSVPGSRCFCITNRQWYFLYSIMKSIKIRAVDQLAVKEAFIPSQLAQYWGSCLDGTAAGDWLLVGRFDGVSVVPAGVVHASEGDNWKFSHELTPLAQTPTFTWLLGIAQELVVSTSGFFMTGKPKRGSPVSVSLEKGQKVDIAKLAEDAGGAVGGLSKIRVGLGWDARRGSGEAFDLDAFVVGCNDAGVALSGDWFVFFNHKEAPNGAIKHHGDELTGAAAGDDESITIDLSALPADLTDLRVFVAIFEAKKRGNLTFSSVDNAFIRLIDEATGTELCRFDLTEDTAASTNTIEFAKLYKHNGVWQFKPVVVETDTEIDGVVTTFKIA